MLNLSQFARAVLEDEQVYANCVSLDRCSCMRRVDRMLTTGQFA